MVRKIASSHLLRKRIVHRRRKIQMTLILHKQTSQALGIAVGLALSIGSQAALAQDGINGPVTLVVAYAPGGSTDLMARTLSQPLSEALGQPVVVENRPGGGTIVGTLGVIDAEPNGQTVLYGTNATLLSQVLRDNESYDPLTDLTPVAMVATQPLAVIANSEVPADTIEELVAHAKENPGELNFASSGNASLQHVAGEMLNWVAEIDMLHIPYTGAGEALTDLLAGRADIMITSLLGVQDYLDTGDLKLLATTGTERSATNPEVPTVAEAGYPDYNALSFQAVFAPRDTPDAVVDTLNAALQEVATEELHTEVQKHGLELAIGSPEELSQFLEQQAQSYKQLVEEVGITLQ
jgi:tripartite-type tricarboxylate transporter receptor subunit TctC